MSLKDFRDCKAQELLEHLEEACVWGTYISFGDFCKYVLNPRISREQQSAYRRKIQAFFTEEQKTQFQKNHKRDPELDLQKYSGRTGI